MLYFRKRISANGYAQQLVIDLNKKTIKKGYFLTINKCIELKTKDFEELYVKFILEGYKALEG